MITKTHPTAQQMESYVLSSVCGSLNEEDPLTAEIEEHLLRCHECVLRAEEEHTVVFAIRSAAALWKGKPAGR